MSQTKQARPRRKAPTFNPIQAAYAVAQYMPADPAVWIERCALAGIQVAVTPCGRLATCYASPHVDIDVEQDQIDFLESWLNLTPGGKDAVIALLLARAQPAKAA